MVGSSQTGSGKTLGFVLPALVRILNMVTYLMSYLKYIDISAQLKAIPHKWTDGPIAVVLVPTRELALQILNESKDYVR